MSHIIKTNSSQTQITIPSAYDHLQAGRNITAFRFV